MTTPTQQPRRISQAGLDLIKRHEGLSLKAYLCPAGVLTIGYGSTGAHVKPGLKITQPQAEALLLKDLERFEKGVAALVKVPLTDNQFAAIVSFAFNVGLGATKPKRVEGLATSTLLRLVNAGDFQQAVRWFAPWNKVDGKVWVGLVKRRAEEAALFQQA